MLKDSKGHEHNLGLLLPINIIILLVTDTAQCALNHTAIVLPLFSRTLQVVFWGGFFFFNIRMEIKGIIEFAFIFVTFVKHLFFDSCWHSGPKSISGWFSVELRKAGVLVEKWGTASRKAFLLFAFFFFF